jgi:hypothetical protein
VHSAKLAKLIVSGDTKLIEQVRKDAISDLPAGKGRPLKAAPFGFFDQGILTGLGMALSSIILAGGGLAYYGYRLWPRR